MTHEGIKGILTKASRLFEQVLQQAEISISEHEEGFDLIDEAIAALEEKPLAEVEGWWDGEVRGGERGYIITLAKNDDPNTIPVTVTIERKPDDA